MICKKWFGGKSWLGLLILRLMIAFILIPAGWHKLIDLDGTAQGFDKIGIPMSQVSALLAALAEALGGLLLALGLFTRPAALFAAFTMFVATLVKYPDGYKYPLLLVAATACLLFTGPGCAAIDPLCKKRCDKK